MKKLALSFYGVTLEFMTPETDLMRDIALDFDHFYSPSPGSSPIRISAALGRPDTDELKNARSLLKTKRWHVLSGHGATRYVLYPEGALTEYNYALREGRVTASSPELLREIVYLLILSRVGEELDLAGLHRLHAAAFELGGHGILLAGNRAAGKTTLLLQLLKDPRCSLISDDTPLIAANAEIKAFPLRFGLAAGNPHLSSLPAAFLRTFVRRHYEPKTLLTPRAMGFAVRTSARASFFFILERRGAEKPGIGQAPFYRSLLELMKTLVIGLGVPQIAEYYLRPEPSDIAHKCAISASRLRTALSVLRHCGFYVLSLSDDPEANAALLKSFIYRRSGKA